MQALKSEPFHVSSPEAVMYRHATHVTPPLGSSAYSPNVTGHSDLYQQQHSYDHYSYQQQLLQQPQHPLHSFPGVSTQGYRRQLQRLAAEHDELKEEHRRLKEIQEAHVKFQCRAQLLADSEPPHVCVEELFGSQREAHRAKVLADLRARCPMQMADPLSVDECYAISRDVYSKIAAFTESENYVSTGGSVCGWTDRRRVEDDVLKFSLTKLFPNLSTHAIAARTWPVLSSPETLQTLYSRSMKMHCEVAQYVDEHNVVIYQEYEATERDADGETDVSVLVRSVFLLTLFQIPDGYVLLFYGLDPSRLHARDEAAALASIGMSDRKVWLDKFSWGIWQDVGDAGEHCNGSFVGAVPAHGASSRYWSVEVLLLAMRWEHEVLGTNLLLPSSDAGATKTEDTAGVKDLGVGGGAGLPLPGIASPRSPSSSPPQTGHHGPSSVAHFGSWSHQSKHDPSAFAVHL